MKRYISFFTALSLMLFLGGCGNNNAADGERYTYRDYVVTMATNWNPHTYETVSDSYPADFIRVGLYSLIYNDALHPAEGKADYEAYSILPEMAAGLPVDVTTAVRAEHPEFGIPEQAVSGYAYTIDLNPNAKWEDGTPIDADTYVYSMKRLLDPELLNYRASDYYAGTLSIAGAKDYATGVSDDFSTVGLYKSGDHQITLVLDKSLGGFNLIYSLTDNFIVHRELYEQCLKKEGDAWFSTYNTSADTTLSYGPYKLVSYQKDKSMRFERNEEWYGYTDGKHIYADPASGKTLPMYQTTAIDTAVVAESATAKMMFLRGELSSYTLQAEDFDTYKNSTYAYETPGETTFFLILNGYVDAIAKREAAEGFDRTKNDIETLTLNSFRRAVALTYERELFASTLSPARSGAFGLIGEPYIYDPENLLYYRNTDAAKRVLCDFYSVDTDEYVNLDAAVASISGYDPEAARKYYSQAFEEALDAGFITDANGDGISDQTVTVEYCMSADSDFMTRTVDYLNTKMAEVTKGTPFDARIRFYKSAPYGNDWASKIKAGLSDTVLAGWSGSVLDPFGLCELYTNPSKQYDANWFDSEAVMLTLEVSTSLEADTVEPVTMSLREWADALVGKSVNVSGRQYNFGEGAADVDTRLNILAAIEGAVLGTYNYIPMLRDGSVSLLTQQAYYPTDSFNPVVGYGGMAYLSYNYTDSEWQDYIASQNGELKY